MLLGRASFHFMHPRMIKITEMSPFDAWQCMTYCLILLVLCTLESYGKRGTGGYRVWCVVCDLWPFAFGLPIAVWPLPCGLEARCIWSDCVQVTFPSLTPLCCRSDMHLQQSGACAVCYTYHACSVRQHVGVPVLCFTCMHVHECVRDVTWHNVTHREMT